jgi:hypothetical protein
MESPQTAERLMTPTAVSIAVGGFRQTHHSGGFFYCLESFVQNFPAPPEPFTAISATDCKPSAAGRNPSPTRMLLGKEICAMNLADAAKRESGFESIVELVASAAVVGLTILGLAEVSPTFLVAFATIVFGVRFLLHGAAAQSQVNVALARHSPSEVGLGVISSGWPTLFLIGVAGIVLGILALLDSSMQLVAIAVIAFGASSLISNNASMRLRTLAAARANADPTLTRIIGDLATRTTDLQTMAESAAIVLGILALSGFAPTKLTLIALLELGFFSSLTSAVIEGTFMRAFPLAPHRSPADYGWSGGHCPRYFGGIIRNCARLEPDDFEPDKRRHRRNIRAHVPPGSARVGSRVATTRIELRQALPVNPVADVGGATIRGLADEAGRQSPPYPTGASL